MIAKDLIDNQLEKIQEYITYRDYRVEKISAVDVAWHLDHSLKVINQVVSILRKSNPEDYKKDFNIRRKVVFAVGRFPRGKGRAPKTVLPPENIHTEDILKQLNEAMSDLKSLDSLDKNAHFKHGIFGMLDLPLTVRFLKIHTNHHLAIIEDIVVASK